LNAVNPPVQGIAVMIDDEFDQRWIGAFIGVAEWHFHRRLWQRYSIVLGVGEFKKIIRDIESGRSPRLESREGGGVYSVRIRSAKQRVLILAIDGLPRTAWPPHMTDGWRPSRAARQLGSTEDSAPGGSRRRRRR
jgi:hypothetical protein